MYNFGEILKDLREEQTLSQMQLSKKVDITQSAIARYELNKTEPRLSDIRKLCQYFEVSADYLLGFTEN